MKTTTTVAVRVGGFTVALADTTVLLHHTTLALEPGRVHAVTGPSGSGKTTLLRALAGALPAGAVTTGRLDVLGEDVLALAPGPLRHLRRHRLAYLGQDPGSGLNPRMRAGRLITETATDRSAATLHRLLTQVRLPTDQRIERRRPAELSGGQQRRVALARALARGPELLLLDEPTAGLDTALRDEIADLLRTLAHDDGATVVLTSHDPAFVARCADTVHTLHSPAAPRPAAVPAQRGAEPTAAEVPLGTAVLTARSLTAHVGTGRSRRQVLTGVDLDVRAGALTAITGPSGCGKTTLLRTLAGLHPATGGTLTLDGSPLTGTHRTRTREQLRRLQLVPQNPLGALNPARTVAATLARPLTLHRTAPREQHPARVAELLGAVGLSADLARRHPHELSGGQRQRVSIARALAADPAVLLCDEVTSALDTATADGVMALLAELRAARGLAVVLVTHDLDLAAHADLTVDFGTPTAGP
ncbi:ABC transporter ATP-binding protein [Kitasatospora sp. NPDC096147]|uniref:ABC transporter ATP-binding protein n=1 Tax=Kitasatospora sp. NPDC096147 TaxID=3364093 RepID=UPI0038196B12